MTAIVPAESNTDSQVIELWLHNRPIKTARVYRADVVRFQNWTRKPLQQTLLMDLTSYWDSLDGLAIASKNRMLSSVRSLLRFGYETGYLRFDVGRAFRLQTSPQRISLRILSESEVHNMILHEPAPRNRTILTLLYATGIRVNELSNLRIVEINRTEDAAHLTIQGKGGKTRYIWIPGDLANLLFSLQDSGSSEDYVIQNGHSARLSTVQIWRIVRDAARRAGIAKKVSPHWLRHAHASHALDRGAPIHLVQATLGHSSIATTGKYLHARPKESSGKFLAI